jgi:hypothetical protein
MATVQTAASSPGVDYDPLRLLWRLLTSVRFALALIGFLALISLLGVVLPQLPAPMRDNPAAVDAWLSLQEQRFGLVTGTLYNLQLFEIFRSNLVHRLRRYAGRERGGLHGQPAAAGLAQCRQSPDARPGRLLR